MATPRALAQYLVNLAHEVREILASLGLKSLGEARGRADLLAPSGSPVIGGPDGPPRHADPRAGE